MLALEARQALDVGREDRVDEQAALAGLGVDAHDRVADGWERSATRSRSPSSWKRSKVRAASCTATSGSTRSRRPGDSGAVGVDEVGPQGVAAPLGDHLGGQDRRQRRPGRERHVGVPAVVVAGPAPRSPMPRRVVPAVEHEDLGVIVVETALQGVGGRELAEGAAEGDLLGRRDVLVAEEHDPPPQQGVRTSATAAVVERGGQIDAVDDGADRPGQRLDRDLSCRHRHSLYPTKRVGIGPAGSANSSRQ